MDAVKIRVLSGRFLEGWIAFRGLRFAYPRLSPVGFRLRVHVLFGRTCFCGISDFRESPFTAGDRDCLSLISQICADNPINLLNLCEPITFLRFPRFLREA